MSNVGFIHTTTSDLNSHTMLRFKCFVRLISLNAQYQILVQSGPEPTSNTAHGHTRPLKSAFTVSFISWCAVGSQQICEQAITRMRRNTAKFLIMAFCGAVAATFCAEVYLDAKSEPGTVGSWPEWLHRNRFHPKISGCQGLLLTTSAGFKAPCLMSGTEQF